MAQPPPAANYPNYGYQQPPAPNQNGNQPQNMPNGFPQAANLPSAKPQQLPPQQTINYQNFQTKAIQPSKGVNGSNSALSSRTSSPGVQQPAIPQSQLPPSRSYQQLHGSQQLPPSSQLPMAPMTNNLNNNGTDSNTKFAPNPMNASSPLPPHPGQGPMAPQQQLSSSMRNLSLNPGPPGSYPSQPMGMPSSKSEQNIMNNNNNVPGMISNQSMPQFPSTKPGMNMAKRPMYPTQPVQNVQPPMVQQNAFPQQPMPQQPMPPQQQPPPGFNNFPASPMAPQPQQLAQQPQRDGLQYQNYTPQQHQQQQQQFPGGVVQQGFNRMWGNDNVDLMQNRHILPATKVLPPPIKLNHQFHEATNCSADIFRCTLTKIPESNSLLQKSRLPLGILIHPYRDLSVS